MKILILLLLSFNLSSQVISTEQGYLLSQEDLATLDYWSRKGIACQVSLDSNLVLLEQIRMANMASDSVTIQLQRTVYNLKKDLNDYATSMDKCVQKTNKLEGSLSEEKDSNKRLKKSNFILKVVIVAITGLFTYTALK